MLVKKFRVTFRSVTKTTLVRFKANAHDKVSANKYFVWMEQRTEKYSSKISQDVEQSLVTFPWV